MHELLERATHEHTPLIDGKTVTFLWQGEDPPRLVGDFNNWGTTRPTVTPEQISANLWAYHLTLPRDAYMEYNLMRGDRRLGDPLNPRTTPSGLGYRQQYFYMPEAAPTPLIQRVHGVPQGKVTPHTVEEKFFLAGGKRTVYLYQPPVEEPCPLLIVFDGRDYFQRAGLPMMVDNLIAQGRIRPLALAMIDNGREARFLEYACNEATFLFIMRSFISFARKHLNLIDIPKQPGAYGVLGASMGGLISLYVAARAPDIFGYVLSQSGAFDIEGRECVIHDLVEHGPIRPLKIWMDVGRYDFLLKANRHMRDRLQRKGYPIAYREYQGGHNYPAWRDDVWRGLEHLFGAV